MSKDLAATSLYGGESPEDTTTPDFLKSGNTASGKLADFEKKASDIVGAVAAAKGGKAPAKTDAGGSGGGNSGIGKKESAKDSFKNGLKGDNKDGKSKGLYNRGGNNNNDNNGEDETLPQKGKGRKSAGALLASPVVIILIGLFLIIALIVALPVLMIGAIDYNLQKILGFDHTIALLEKVGSFITSEFLSEGKVPSGYASDLAKNGIDVGQVLANGDFVRTDTYIANIEDRDDLVAAASGFSYISDDEGELAILYDGKIIRADEFVAAVESDPVLYAGYSTSADIATKYYYGEDVEAVYQEMGISRGNFNDWEKTGNYKEEEEQFNEILEKVLNSDSDMVLGGYYNDEPKPGTNKDDDEEEDEEETASGTGGTFMEPTTDGRGAGEYTSALASDTREYIDHWETGEYEENGVKKNGLHAVYSNNATKRAAELLNTAISSNEPYLAANAFIAIEEPIQRARVDGDGPVNVVMNTLTQGKTVTFQDIQTGANKTKSFGILETANFRAAVSDSNYSTSEALDFSRDRVLKVTEQADTEIIKKTTVTSDGKPNTSSVVRNGKATEADHDIIDKATDSFDLGVKQSNYEVFQSVIGGNRVIEGGSFLSNTITMKTIGAMPSDDGKIAEYKQVVDEVLARKAEAERATKSPFDISSPNTFLGLIVHNITTSILANYGSGLTALSAVKSAGNTASKAIASLAGTVTAAGGNDEFITMDGDSCETVGAVSVKGDLYCTSHNTPSTDNIGLTLGEWKAQLGGNLDSEGNVVDDSELYQFMEYGMDRTTTVGVKNAEVCKKYRDKHDTAWDKITDLFNKMKGLYDVCDEDKVPVEISTGANYTFGAEGNANNDLYSGYVMYNEVRSLLTGEKSEVAKMRERNQEEYPIDDSRAGKIARRSGMTKEEAEIALAYADYLDMIANYNPASRYAFAAPVVLIEKPILEKHSDDIALNLYAWRSKESEYDDLRTRNFVV